MTRVKKKKGVKMVLAAETIRNGSGGSQKSATATASMGRSLGGSVADPESGTSDQDDIKSEKSNGGGSERGSLKQSAKNNKGEYEAEKIRVGRDYQAVCPDLAIEKEKNPEQLAEKALLVWSPTKDIPDTKLEDYIRVAKERYGYNGEQALGMLFWHKHDLERAVQDLANFTPFPDEWTVEDKVLFEQAFQFHGKSFNRIRQMLPDKSIASLVKYYYSWKKSRARPMTERPERNKVKTDGVSENGSEPCSNEVSDEEEKILVDEDTTNVRTSPQIVTGDNNVEPIQSVVQSVPPEPISLTATPTQRPTTTVAPPATPNLDEITIIPINSRSSSSKDASANNSDSDAPPPAKVPKLDSTAVSIIKRPQVANP